MRIFAYYLRIFAKYFFVNMRTNIIERKISYEVNTGIKYIKSDGKNKEYMFTRHKHVDYELRIITKGRGSCSIGELIIDCKKYDIMLIGPNIPHCPAIYTSPENIIIESEILQFHPDIFPQRIHELSDYIFLAMALDKSRNGLVIRNRLIALKIKSIMGEMKLQEGVEKIASLFRIIEILGKAKDHILVTEDQIAKNNSFSGNCEPIQKVSYFLYQNMKYKISLNDVSSYVNLNPTALCRMFKNKTHMTIFEFLNKIRLEHVCRLLLYSELPINQVAYESGFNNIAHFNRQFKITLKISPSDYRKNGREDFISNTNSSRR